jgi:hypothetical protein
MAELRRPIIIIGTHRSGTTFLGKVFRAHPDVAYWEEPRHVWAWKHNFRSSDALAAKDAKPGIVRHIHRAFRERMESEGKSRFCEKTPSNCLRLDFIEAVFPDAIYVHIYRDGRAVVRSTGKVLGRGPDTHWMSKRLLGTPVWEWPAYAPRAARTIGRKLLGKQMTFWGPRPPGWRSWLKEHPGHVVRGLQWVKTIEPVLEFRDRVEPSRWAEMRYEDFMADPIAHFERLREHAGLAPAEEPLEYLRERVDPTRQSKWRRDLSDEVLADLRPHLEPTLERLGYEW